MSPNRNNRLTLSKDKLDPFGNPGLDLHFDFSGHDLTSFSKGEKLTHKIFNDLGAHNIKKLKELHWSHHHIGSTRMSKRPSDGVVDPNLLVHGTKNLYVASSSVFVTGGVANPTLTITALALRLADHLEERPTDA